MSQAKQNFLQAIQNLETENWKVADQHIEAMLQNVDADVKGVVGFAAKELRRTYINGDDVQRKDAIKVLGDYFDSQEKVAKVS